MATRLIVSLSSSTNFIASTFNGTVSVIPGINTTTVAFVRSVSAFIADNTASPNTFIPALGAGNTYIFNFFFNNSGATIVNSGSTIFASFDFKNNNGDLLGNVFVKLTHDPDLDQFFANNLSVTIACLHGDSIVQSNVGPQKIKDTKRDDQVLTGENKFAKVLDLVQCWIQVTGAPTPHDAIIFEPNSLGEGEPSERLIIDPGHPMATKANFEKHGIAALKKAGEYLGTASENLIYLRKWSDPIIQTNPEKQSIRYDLILEEPHETYIANGVVVKARESVHNPGYDHRYGDFV